jgi:hypothetical protein
MSGRPTVRTVAQLFEPPFAVRWLPAFAAAAIGDPVAGAALGPYIGPANVPIGGGTRPRTPGEEHFARTWVVIKPGFTGTGRNATYAEHTRADHRRTRIPAELIALPIQWIQLMTAIVVHDMGRNERLVAAIRAAGQRFGRDIEADLTVVGLPLRAAKENLATYFARVEILPQQAQAFWAAMDHGPVRADLGGVRGRVDVAAIQATLVRHLPAQLVRQYMAHRPR